MEPKSFSDSGKTKERTDSFLFGTEKQENERNPKFLAVSPNSKELEPEIVTFAILSRSLDLKVFIVEKN